MRFIPKKSKTQLEKDIDRYAAIDREFVQMQKQNDEYIRKLAIGRERLKALCKECLEIGQRNNLPPNEQIIGALKVLDEADAQNIVTEDPKWQTRNQVTIR